MLDNPTLNREHIDRIRSVAQLRSVRSGEVLYEPSCPDVPLFIVLDGIVSISRAGEDEKVLAIRESGQFTGEMSLISGNRPLVTARVTQDGAVLELTREKVLSLMAKDTEVGDILMGAFVARRLLAIQLGEGNVVLFGTKSSGRALALREFLTRNGHPFTYVDIDTDSCASELMEKLAVRNGEIPVVYCNRRYVLRNPSIAELAACLDLNINVDKGVRDVLVIGAGPGGLAAAVYAASEGLKTLVIEKSAPGGQAGSSSKIENYLGFPTGLSGQELANRSIAQAQKFGAQLMVAQSVVHIDCSRQPYRIVLESGLKFNARSVVIATGAQYARLPVEEADAFAGRGIYYNATHMEAQLCDSEEVAVVGLRAESFATGGEFLARGRTTSPSCLVLDVRLPQMSGLDFQRQLTKIGIHIPIIFITAHGDVPMSVRALKSGAVDFLTKPFRDQELLDAIQQALERDRASRKEQAEILDVHGRYQTLTAREREVMALVVSGLLNKQIASEIGASEATVKIHRGNMMQKMQVGSLIELVRMADKIKLIPVK